MNSLTTFSKGGGGSRGVSSKSISSTKGSASGSNSSSKSTLSKPPVGKSTAKAGDKIKTSDGKEIQTSAKKPTNSKYTQNQGVVGDNGYKPRFTNGYSAPSGSVVYYPQHSFVDYLPWIYLFSHNSPQNDHATVVQPDGKEVDVKPEPQGVDGLYILNWIILIVIALIILGGIVWAVDKFYKSKKIIRHA